MENLILLNTPGSEHYQTTFLRAKLSFTPFFIGREQRIEWDDGGCSKKTFSALAVFHWHLFDMILSKYAKNAIFVTCEFVIVNPQKLLSITELSWLKGKLNND